MNKNDGGFAMSAMNTTVKWTQLKTNTPHLHGKHIATRTLKRHGPTGTVQLDAALRTRTHLHLRLLPIVLPLSLLEILESLHAQRVVGDVHHAVVVHAHPTRYRDASDEPVLGEMEEFGNVLHRTGVERIEEFEVVVSIP